VTSSRGREVNWMQWWGSDWVMLQVSSSFEFFSVALVQTSSVRFTGHLLLRCLVYDIYLRDIRTVNEMTFSSGRFGYAHVVIWPSSNRKCLEVGFDAHVKGKRVCLSCDMIVEGISRGRHFVTEGKEIKFFPLPRKKSCNCWMAPEPLSVVYFVWKY